MCQCNVILVSCNRVFLKQNIYIYAGLYLICLQTDYYWCLFNLYYWETSSKDSLKHATHYRWVTLDAMSPVELFNLSVV